MLVVHLLQQFVTIVGLFGQQFLLALSRVPHLLLPLLREDLLQLADALPDVRHTLLVLLVLRRLLDVARHFDQQLVQRGLAQVFPGVDGLGEENWTIVELRQQFEDVGLLGFGFGDGSRGGSVGGRRDDWDLDAGHC